jgi:uncharacterized protein (TIGR02677 family)
VDDDTVVEEETTSERRDERGALAYLVLGEVSDYIAIMDVLESSVNDLSPAQIVAAITNAGHVLDLDVIERRLDQLREWGNVHATTNESKVLRVSDILARNWRYSATAVGRRVHRFYRTQLSGTLAPREIPLANLNQVVRALQSIRDNTADDLASAINTVFVNHDSLDEALIGAEDALTGLADRYDLDPEKTAELRQLLVDYATRVSAELGRGSHLASDLLDQLHPRFPELVSVAVAASNAKDLIERGALEAARGGRIEDWRGLCQWFDAESGRAYRFAMRLVRALPGMHANLRRLHTSSGTATSRARALTLARACGNQDFGSAIALAALGDHGWRKLHGEADDTELPRVLSWASGPQVAVPDLMRLVGRGGSRGRAPAARDDSTARTIVERLRAERAAEHRRLVDEILATVPGGPLSAGAAQVALDTLMATVRQAPRSGVRVVTRDGLACTMAKVLSPQRRPALHGPSWSVWTPGREVVFHRPGTTVPRSDVIEDTDARPQVVVASSTEVA